MKKSILYLFAFSSFATIVSCKKENSSGSGSALTGSWKFVSIHAQTTSTDQYTDGSVYKTITNSEYTSTDNGGSVDITATTMTGTGITYKVSDNAYAFDYIDNVLVDSFSSPFSVSIPPLNSVTTYKIVNSDSVYFTSQSFLGAPGASSSGAKFSISGNILTLTSNFVKDTTINDGGTLISQHETALAVSTLQKQ